MNNVRPKLTLLDEEQIQQIHGYALRILAETGVRVDSPSVAERLGKTGQARVQDGNFSNYSMAGASTPLTPAGTLALLLAALLAGLTISQVMKPGTPVLLGMLPVYFDMKSMLNFYDPQSILLNLACAEMMAHYGLPHCGTSGSGTGWGMDLIH